MPIREVQWGGLTCRAFDELPDGEHPRLVVILCHGFGAPGTDLVSLGSEILSLNPNLGSKVRFIFPEGPLSLDEMGMYGSRAWWYLDVAALTAAIEQGEFRDLRNDVPDGLKEARNLLLGLLEDIQRETELPTSRIVLGGFSQGAMLATDVALRLKEPPAGLCVLSGTLLSEKDWRELAGQRGAMPVLQSHGDQDPILPYQAAEWLRDMFRESGLEVEFVPFAGMHTIGLKALERFAAFLGRLADE